MAKNFLEGFARGFSITGADILDRQQKQADEIDAYSQKVDKQKEADVWVQKELMKAKQDVSTKNSLGASFLFNQRNELGSNAIDQGKTMFTPMAPGSTAPVPTQAAIPTGTMAPDVAASTTRSLFDNSADAPPNTSDPETLDPTAIETDPNANIDGLDNTTTDTTVIEPLANNTTITREDFEAAKASLPASTLENSSPEAVYTIAMAKARKEKAKGGLTEYQRGMLGIRATEAGIGADGKIQSYVDQNPDITDTVKAAGLPKEIISPLLTKKGAAAKDNASAALKASSDYFNGKDFRDDLGSAQTLNDQLTTILGLSKDADTGLTSGPINAIVGKLGGDDKGVLELQSFARGLAPRMRVQGSGSSSDTDVRLLLDSLASISNPKNVNEKVVTNLLNQSQKVVEHIKFDAWLHDNAVLAAPGKAAELFDKYWAANPAFVKGQNGVLAQNPTRVDFQNWDFGKNSPKQTMDANTGEPAAPQDALAQKLPLLHGLLTGQPQ